MTILKSLIKSAGDLAHSVLIEHKQDELMTMFHLVAPDDGGKDLVIGTPWKNEREKLMLIAQVKKASHEMGAVAAMFVGEVWLSEYPPDADITMMDPPSQQPNRIEAVFAVAIDNEGNTETGQWNMIRSRPGGPLIGLVETKTFKNKGNFGGRILNGLVLPKKG